MSISPSPTNSIIYPNDSFTDLQNCILPIIHKLSGLASFIGSLLITIDILKKKKEPQSQQQQRVQRRSAAPKKSNTQKRLLLGLSLFDMIQSACHFCSTWPIPVDSSPQYAFIKFNIGNQTSCTVQGFLIFFSGGAVPLYNAFLCIYYLICVKYKRNSRFLSSDRKIATRIEPIFHFIAIMLPLFLSIHATRKEYFNPISNFCFIAAYPRKCDTNKFHDVECIRGENATTFRMWTVIVGSSACLIIMIGSLTILYYEVKTQGKRMTRYSFVTKDPRQIPRVEAQITENSNNEENIIDNSSPMQTSQKKQQNLGNTFLERITGRNDNDSSTNNMDSNQSSNSSSAKRVLNRAISYVVAFLLVWVPTVAAIIVASSEKKENPTVAFVIQVFVAIFSPLQVCTYRKPSSSILTTKFSLKFLTRTLYIQMVYVCTGIFQCIVLFQKKQS